MSQIQYDIFISYSSKDKDSALHICKALEKEGFICWIAPRNIGVGHYANAIVEAIENSKALLLIFSSNSNQSTPVLNEIEIAVNKQLPIIPIRIEDILPTKSMKYYLMSNNWFDVFDFNADLKKVIDTVKKTLDKNYISSIPTIENKKTFSFSSLKFLIIVFIFIIIGILFFRNNFFKENNIPREKMNIAIEILSKEITKQVEEKVYWKKKYFELKEQYQDYPHLISKAEEIQENKGFQEAVSFYLNIKEGNYQEFEIKNISSSNRSENIIQEKDINKLEVNQNFIDNEELDLVSKDTRKELLEFSLKNLVENYTKLSKEIIQRYQSLIEDNFKCQAITEQLIYLKKEYGANTTYTSMYIKLNNDCNSLYGNRLKEIMKLVKN